MRSYLSNLKVFFTNRIGLILVFSNLILAIVGFRIKEWNFSSFHFYYEPFEIKLLSIINLPAICFGQFFYGLMFSRSPNPWSMIFLSNMETSFIVIFSIFQWLLIGYLLELLIKSNQKEIK